MYAVVTQPERYGRSGWESYDSLKHARYIAAFYRYTYGFTAEVWTRNPDGTLGKCLKREVIDATHPRRKES